MKKTAMLIGILLVCLVASATVAVAGAPDWVNGPKIFEKDGYVYAVGKFTAGNVALARSMAADKARRALARHLRTKVLRIAEVVGYYKSGKTWHAIVRIKK